MTIPLKKKNEAGSKLLEAISTLERVAGESVQEVQADWGKEFRSNEFQGELWQPGIIAKETVPYYSETNALIERVNHPIMAIAADVQDSCSLRFVFSFGFFLLSFHVISTYSLFI
jgi:transposase InsO family protein